MRGKLISLIEPVTAQGSYKITAGFPSLYLTRYGFPLILFDDSEIQLFTGENHRVQSPDRGMVCVTLRNNFYWIDARGEARPLYIDVTVHETITIEAEREILA